MMVNESELAQVRLALLRSLTTIVTSKIVPTALWGGGRIDAFSPEADMETTQGAEELEADSNDKPWTQLHWKSKFET
jgi:hypothetical protein